MTTYTTNKLKDFLLIIEALKIKKYYFQNDSHDEILVAFYSRIEGEIKARIAVK